MSFKFELFNKDCILLVVSVYPASDSAYPLVDAC